MNVLGVQWCRATHVAKVESSRVPRVNSGRISRAKAWLQVLRRRSLLLPNIVFQRGLWDNLMNKEARIARLEEKQEEMDDNSNDENHA